MTSVPVYTARPPRPLTGSERAALVRIADQLIGAGTAGPAPSAVDDFDRWLDRALAARRDSFEAILALAEALAEVPEDQLTDALRAASSDPTSAFSVLGTVLAGAYLMVPEVRCRLGYPGQGEHPAPFDQSAEELMTGVLDPVMARPPVYRKVP